MNNIGLLTIFMLSVFVGFEVISKVSTILHTPLMSGANAIHGVILVGAILITGESEGAVQLTLGLLATGYGPAACSWMRTGGATHSANDPSFLTYGTD